MFGAIYNGLTGLMGFSRGLDVISNNVANLNTPGFKSSQLQFKDLFYSYQFADDSNGGAVSLQIGAGVGTSATSLRFTQGEIRETGNDVDAAINGNGFFVLRKEGKVFFSRAGQFEFDQDGYLVDRTNKARAAALDAGGALQDINIAALRASPPSATTEVKFVDNLSVGGTPTAPLRHEINDLVVYDASGGTHTLKLHFRSTAARRWTIEVKDTNDNVIATGEVRFQGNGSPEVGFNTMSFSFAPNGTTPTTIVLNMGEPGSFSGATGFSGGTTSSLKVSSKNGSPPGSLTSATFDEQGYLVLNYSNGQKDKRDRLALGWFDHLQGLEQAGGNLFLNNTGQEVHWGRPGDGIMGKVVAKSIELSNVDLTQQFTDMIIVQRGYQGSSQIISVTNEMIQQLFDLRGKR